MYAGLDRHFNDETDLNFNLSHAARATRCKSGRRRYILTNGGCVQGYARVIQNLSTSSRGLRSDNVSNRVLGANLLIVKMPAVPAFNVFNRPPHSVSS